MTQPTLHLLKACIIITIVLTSCNSNSNSNEDLKNYIFADSINEIQIGKQIWKIKNLDVDTFSNGDLIPKANSSLEWELAAKKKQPAWCYYENDSLNYSKFGKLYNWYAVTDIRSIAIPFEWRIPSNEDWQILLKYLSNYPRPYKSYLVGSKLKSAKWNGKNESGFEGLPAGWRTYNGEFDGFGEEAIWWSSDWRKNEEAFALALKNEETFANFILVDMGNGFSIRLLKDLE